MEKGVSIKVETNGSSGIKNVLTKEEIEHATCIIVAADKNVEMSRFDGKKVIITKVADGIHKADELIDRAVKGDAPVYHASQDHSVEEASNEKEILACNTLCHEDAIRALAMLKTQMGGEAVAKPEKQWNPNVKSTNLELISNVTGKPIELVENETSLPMSQKRKEKYS